MRITGASRFGRKVGRHVLRIGDYSENVFGLFDLARLTVFGFESGAASSRTGAYPLVPQLKVFVST